MVRISKLLLLALCLLFWACKDQKLLITKKNIAKDPVITLRLDGFYWANVKVESEIIGIKTFFLYNNKTILSGGWLNNIVEPKKDIVFVNRNMNSGMSKKIKSKWGAFRIYEKKIEFEKWEPSSGGPMKTVIRKGDILNDTTFVIRKRINNYDGKTYLVQDTFRFMQFSPKPDSTNRFVK